MRTDAKTSDFFKMFEDCIKKKCCEPCEIPEEIKKKEPWATLGVNVEKGFEPLYIVAAKKKKVIKELKDALKDAEELLIATDEDREGESIGWHLVDLLKPKVPVKRMVFSEITKEAIQEAIRHTRQLDDNLVSAQETRRVLDRAVLGDR